MGGNLTYREWMLKLGYSRKAFSPWKKGKEIISGVKLHQKLLEYKEYQKTQDL